MTAIKFWQVWLKCAIIIHWQESTQKHFIDQWTKFLVHVSKITCSRLQSAFIDALLVTAGVHFGKKSNVLVLRPYLISLQNLRSGSKINQCDCAWESIHMFFWPYPLRSPLALCTDHSPFWGVPESRCDHGPGEEEKEIRTIQPGVSWHHRSPGATTDASCCHYNHPTPNPYPLIT